VKRFTLRKFHRITNPSIRRIHKTSIHDFMSFTGIVRPEEGSPLLGTASMALALRLVTTRAAPLSAS
jgi:hypothetical protein